MDYARLKQQITDWALPGGEACFTAQVPHFIRLAEARFNREIRAHNMIGVSEMVTSQPFPSMPPDWLETIAVTDRSQWPGGSVPLKHLTINQQQCAFYGVGVPWGYANTDGGFRLVPSPNAARTYEVTYYRALEPLSDCNSCNWLLFTSPDLYLSCCLQFAQDYLQNDEAMQKYAALATDAIGKINMQSKDQEFSRGQPIVRAISFG